MWRTPSWVAVLAVWAAVLVLSASPAATYDHETEQGGQTSPQSVRQIAVTLQNFSISPGTITAAPGETVTFVVTNSGSAFHTFTLTRSRADRTSPLADLGLSPGEQKSVTVTMPNAATELYLFCRPHELAGMVATVRVGEAAAPTLTDIPGHWAAGQIQAAVAAGIVVAGDYAGGTFDPNGVIPRLEMALLVARAVDLAAQAEARAGRATSFSDDAQIPTARKGYVSVLVEAKLISGYPDGTFGPNRGLTRAEAVVMLARVKAYREAN